MRFCWGWAISFSSWLRSLHKLKHQFTLTLSYQRPFKRLPALPPAPSPSTP